MKPLHMYTLALRTSSIIAAIFMISGCSSAPPLIPAPKLVVESGERWHSVPSLNTPARAMTGDNLYARYKTVTNQTYTVTLENRARASMDLGNELDVSAGRQGPLLRTAHSGRQAICWSSVTKSVVTGASHACLVDNRDTGVFDAAMFQNRERDFPLVAPVPYTVAPDPVDSRTVAPSFKREVLYQGVSKGTVKLSFREFSNDMARPAFTQDILYDLEPDGTALVVFRGLQVKILKAASAELDYVVLSDFKD
jgi:hypothetical protein